MNILPEIEPARFSWHCHNSIIHRPWVMGNPYHDDLIELVSYEIALMVYHRTVSEIINHIPPSHDIVMSFYEKLG